MVSLEAILSLEPSLLRVNAVCCSDAMPAARLSDIVGALEMQFDESSSFLDLDTGQVKTVSRDPLLEAEESGDEDEERDLPEWQQQEWEIAKRIISTDRFRKLPTKFHEVREDLLRAIHGAGAFPMFKDTIRRHCIEAAWFAFRAEAPMQIALD